MNGCNWCFNFTFNNLLFIYHNGGCLFNVTLRSDSIRVINVANADALCHRHKTWIQHLVTLSWHKANQSWFDSNPSVEGRVVSKRDALTTWPRRPLADKWPTEDGQHVDTLSLIPFGQTGWVAEWIKRSPRSREVAGSGPGRAKSKALKLVLVVSSLDDQH